MEVMEMIKLDQIRFKIIEAIKQCELTQTHLASLLGVGQQTISHYLKGDKLPALDTFANLCKILDLDPADMLCLKD